MMIVALVRIARLTRGVTRSDPKRFSPIFATDLAPARHDSNDILEPSNLYLTRSLQEGLKSRRRRAALGTLARASLVGMLMLATRLQCPFHQEDQRNLCEC